MKTRLIIASVICVFLMTPTILNAGGIIDTFTATTLNPYWTLVTAPDAFGAGGGVVFDGTVLRFNNVGNYVYAYIRTTDMVDTTRGIRTDAIMRQDTYPTATWGMSVNIYYDENNWVGIKQGDAGGQSGFLRYGFVNGVSIYADDIPNVGCYSYFLISGIELTATQIKFYGSSLVPIQDKYGITDIDSHVSEITSFTMARPANFTGPAVVIIGKGYTNLPGYPNPYLQNEITSNNWAFSGIDYARVLAGPSFCGDAGTQYMDMDFNEDCNVDFDDFAAFAMEWAQCSDPANSACDEYWKPTPNTNSFQVWDIDPYINIVRNQTPSGPELSSISIQMAKNEYRDRTFMVTTNDDFVILDVNVQPLGGLPANAILVEKTMFTRNRAVPRVDTADAVLPLTGSLFMGGHESHQLRLRFDSRFSGIEAGTYSFNVILSDLYNPTQKTITGTLQIWNIDLPSYDNLPNNTWAELYACELAQPAVLPGAVGEMKKYGLNRVFIVPYETPNADSVDDNGNILHFDTTAFDAKVSAIQSAWNSGSGTDHLQWIISLSGKINNPEILPSLGMTRSDIVFPSALWQTVYGQYLSLLKANLAAKGIAVGDWMLAFADESDANNLINLEIPVAEFTKTADPSIKNICNSSAKPGGTWDARYLAAFDVFQPHFESMVANPSILTWLKTSGKPIWTYRSSGDMCEVGKNVYDYYRVYAWNLLKYGYTGTGLWTYCSQGGGYGREVWYDPTPCWWLAFKHYANDDVVHSRRYEMYREGSDDYRYVLALRSIAAEKGKTAEAETLIQQAITDITGNITNTSRCEYWRLQIAQRILTYQAL